MCVCVHVCVCVCVCFYLLLLLLLVLGERGKVAAGHEIVACGHLLVALGVREVDNVLLVAGTGAAACGSTDTRRGAGKYELGFSVKRLLMKKVRARVNARDGGSIVAVEEILGCGGKVEADGPGVAGGVGDVSGSHAFIRLNSIYLRGESGKRFEEFDVFDFTGRVLAFEEEGACGELLVLNGELLILNGELFILNGELLILLCVLLGEIGDLPILFGELPGVLGDSGLQFLNVGQGCLEVR